MATLTIPDTTTIADLERAFGALGKSLKVKPARRQPEDIPNGRNTRLTADQPGSRVAAGQRHAAGDKRP